VRYVDETLGLSERIKPILVEQGGVESLTAFVIFWANYIPDIYGIAKALLTVRESDESAALAWADRMKVLMEGCKTIVRCLQNDDTLSPEWTPQAAADYLWATFSIETWEHLTIERGWTMQQYIERITMALKRTLVKLP
jgi:hypothetical protein